MMRNAKLTKFDDGSGEYTINVKFHEWGTLPYHNDNETSFGITAGIVEFENGEIMMVSPKRIKFED